MQKFIWITTFLSLCVMVFIIFFMDSFWIEKQIINETESIEGALGIKTKRMLVSEADRWYAALVKESGVESTSYNMFMPKTRHDLDPALLYNSRFFDNYVEPTIDKFWMQMYQAILRLSLFKTWFLLCVPLVLAAMVDGMMARKVKQHTFGFTSPFRYRFSLYSLELSLVFIVIYLSLPISLEFSAWVPLAWFLSMAVSLTVLMSNMQKRV